MRILRSVKAPSFLTPQLRIALGILAVNLVLMSPQLLHSYSSINAFDEAKYIESGRLLLKGQLRSIAWGPAVSLVYAPFHLVFGSSPDWFLLESWAGRIVLYSLAWAGTLYFARRFGKDVLFISLAVLFVSTSPLSLLSNQSDALFAFFSAVGLAALLEFLSNQDERNLLIASTCVGLGILTRFESVLLIPAMLVALSLTGKGSVSLLRKIALGIGPCFLVLSAYLVAYMIAHPGSSLGVQSKSYASFEVNHPLQEGASDQDRMEAARETFGTTEENQGSVILALTRHPGAAVKRILDSILLLPPVYLDEFGKQLGPATGLLALAGLIQLFGRRSWRDLLIILLWTTPALSSIMFLSTHLFRQTFYIVLALAAVGIEYLFQDSQESGRRRFLILAFSVALLGLLGHKLAIFASSLVLAAALTIYEVARGSFTRVPIFRMMGAAIMLAAGLILRPPFRFPNYTPFEEARPDELVQYMTSLGMPGARVLESLPLPANAAKMIEIPWSDVPPSVDTLAEFHAWLQRRSISLVLASEGNGPPNLWSELNSRNAGDYFELGFTSESGRSRVYLVQPGP